MRLGFYINSALCARGRNISGEPEPAVVAALAEASGVEITLIGWASKMSDMTERDVRLICEIVGGDILFVVPPDSAVINAVVKYNPQGVILSAPISTSEPIGGAFNIQQDIAQIEPIIAEYKAAGLPVGALVEPEVNGLKALARAGLSTVALDCIRLTRANTDQEAETALDLIADCALAAHKLGLAPAAARGLSYRNVGHVARVRYLEEIYVGSAIVSRSLLHGISKATSDFVTIIHRNQILP